MILQIQTAESMGNLVFYSSMPQPHIEEEPGGGVWRVTRHFMDCPEPFSLLPWICHLAEDRGDLQD